jgi:hypothetical protein
MCTKSARRVFYSLPNAETILDNKIIRSPRVFGENYYGRSIIHLYGT